MERYDYEEAVKNDVRQYLEDNWAKDRRITEAERNALYDDLFVYDEVTGNGSGSYTYNRQTAEEYVCHNLDLLGEAIDEFGVDGATLRKKLDGEWADVTIRCMMLGRVLDSVIEEWNDNIGKEEGNAS